MMGIAELYLPELMSELRLCWYSKLENYNTQHLLMLYRAQMNQQLQVNLKGSP